MVGIVEIIIFFSFSHTFFGLKSGWWGRGCGNPTQVVCTGSNICGHLRSFKFSDYVSTEGASMLIQEEQQKKPASKMADGANS